MIKPRTIILLSVFPIIGVIASTAFILTQEKPQIEEVSKLLKEAHTALDVGEFERTISIYAEILETQPENLEALKNLYDLIYEYDPERAEQVIGLITDLSPTDPFILSRKLSKAIASGNTEEIEFIRGSIPMDDSILRDRLYAQLLISLFDRNVDEAIGILEKFDEIHPNFPQVNLIKGELYSQSSSIVERIMGKRILFDLLKRNDSFAKSAGLRLLLAKELPMLKEDFKVLFDHLYRNPVFTSDLSVYETELLRFLSNRSIGTNNELTRMFLSEIISREDGTEQDSLNFIDFNLANKNAGEVADQLKLLKEKKVLSISESVVLLKYAIAEADSPFIDEVINRIPQEVMVEKEFLNLLRSLLSLQYSNLPEESKWKIINKLLSHPQSTTSDWLSILNATRSFSDDLKAKFLSQGDQRFSASEPKTKAFWLYQTGQHDKAMGVLSSMDPESMTSDSVLMKFELLISRNQSQEAISFLSQYEHLIPEDQYGLRIAQAYFKMGNPEAGKRTIKDKFLAHYHSIPIPILFTAINLCNQYDSKSLSKELYAAAFERGAAFSKQHSLIYLSMLLNPENLKTAELLAIHSRNLYPTDPIFINNDVYLQAIAEENLEQNIQDMREVIERFPDVSDFRTTLALVELLGGYPEAAMVTLESSEYSLNLDSSKAKFVFSIVLSGNGKEGLAQNIIPSINMDELLPVEIAILRRFTGTTPGS